MKTAKAADWPPFVSDLNFSSWEPSPDYALVTIRDYLNTFCYHYAFL